MVYQLSKTQQLYCNLETAWNFFSSPRNLYHITPKEMNFKVIPGLPEGNIFEGMIINYMISPVLGMPLHWQTKIIKVNEQESFTDIQLKGPYKRWNHFHEFIPNEQGVLMKDTVDYELPLSIIGSIAHTLWIRNKLEAIFAYRHSVCGELFNSKIQPG